MRPFRFCDLPIILHELPLIHIPTGRNSSLVPHPPEPLNPMLPLAIGDYIHNLRSALDHMVFQLALLNGSGEDSARKTAFPIYLTPQTFGNFADRRVAPFISSSALAEIEKLQPYATGNAGEGDVLWILSQLDIIDKHRVLVVLAQLFRPVHASVKVP